MCSLVWQAKCLRSGGGKGRKVWSLRGVKGSHLFLSVTGQRLSSSYTPALRQNYCYLVGLILSVHISLTMRKAPGEELSRRSST